MHSKKNAIAERLHALGRHADAIRLDDEEEARLEAAETAAMLERLGVPASQLLADAAPDPRVRNV